MTDPIQFAATTPRHGLPLLFAGQAQKEFFVNAAFGQCDALLHPSVEGEAVAPPLEPAEGDCWLVGPGATGEFEGKSGYLAFRQAGEWCFAAPLDGMRLFDRSASQFLVNISGWRREGAVSIPSAGQTVDTEARSAIEQLIGALTRHGILPGE
jgi:hypothetical protein